MPEATCPVLSYGQGPGLDWTLTELENGATATSFTVLKNGKEYGRFSSPLPGRHNALNVLATLAVLDRLGVERQTMARELARFQGVKRRQEVRGIVAGVTVIDDFAHHPTAVAETLAALRGKYAGHRLIAVFDPRTNSSRRRVFQDAYVATFDPADLVIIREPEPLTAVPEAERFSARQLVADLGQRGVNAYYGTDTNAILTQLTGLAADGDVIAILSNGGFDNIHQQLLEILTSKGKQG
jgi:UDP-N-acetylmuramate: L-alanyl-gamma-D-glutamyl-meso-diaminopimelate ligase